MLIEYMTTSMFTFRKYKYSSYDPCEDIVHNWRNKIEKRMKFKGYLKKDKWLIRVSSNAAGAFQIEYSQDNLMTKTVKVYKSRYHFLKAMESKFAPDELSPFLT